MSPTPRAVARLGARPGVRIGAWLLLALIVVALIRWLALHGHLVAALWLIGGVILGLLLGAGLVFRKGRRVIAAAMGFTAVLIAASVGAYGWNLNHKLDQIDRAPDASLDKGHRPKVTKKDPKTETRPLNLLLMGSDGRVLDPDQPTVAEMLADGKWEPGILSDSLMVVHISADRKDVSVLSIPRDTYLPIFDDEGRPQGRNRINAAFSYYGPYGTWRTVENFARIRLDHMAIIDFAGFRELTTAIGGVDVYVPETVTDTYQDVTWEKGWVHLEGDLALKYVRTRHGLSNGDFDRVARQQNFLRAVLKKVVADDTIGNPRKLSATVDAIANHLTVDEGWSNEAIRDLVLSLRGLELDQVTFVTLPLDSYRTLPELGSVNIINPARCRELWRAFATDRLDQYLKRHPEDELKSDREVS